MSEPFGDKARKRRVSSTEEALSPMALYSAEAEKAVLGCMIAQPGEVIDEANEILTDADFFVPAHQEIFEALIGMWKNQMAIDVMTIHQWFVDRKMADSLGSPGILAEMLVGFATHLNVGSYIKIVKDKATLRALQSACSAIVQDIVDMPDSVSTVLDRAEAQIMAVTGPSIVSVGFSAPGTIMDSEMERICSFDGRRPINGISSGFHRLDQLTTGWHAGEMIVLAARPGIGKTSLALDFAHNASHAKWSEEKDAWVTPGDAVGVICLEMTTRELEMRRLSKKSGIGLQKLRIGLTDAHERSLLRMAREDMRAWPIIIRDPSYLTLTQLRSMARRMKQQHGMELLIIDYMQLLKDPTISKGDNRQVEVANISRGVKGLAKELGIPIIILAQLNRKSEESKAPPALHNLRESGSIEQDADVVLLLHRQDFAKDQDGNEIISPIQEYTLNVAKQRNGPCDEVKIMFNSTYTRFDDPARN